MTPPRQHIDAPGSWEERAGYARAVRVGDHVWASATSGAHPDGSVPDDVVAQTRVALRTVERALADVGARIADVVMLRVYLVDGADREAITAALHERVEAARPAATFVHVAALRVPEERVAIEAEAVAGSA